MTSRESICVACGARFQAGPGWPHATCGPCACNEILKDCDFQAGTASTEANRLKELGPPDQFGSGVTPVRSGSHDTSALKDTIATTANSTFPADAAGSNTPPSSIHLDPLGTEHLPGLYSLHIYPAEMTELGTAIRKHILELMVRYQIFKRRGGPMANAVLSLNAAKALGAFYRRTFIEKEYEVL